MLYSMLVGAPKTIGYGKLTEANCVGRWDLRTGDSLGRGVQEIKHVFHAQSEDLTGNPKAREAALNGDQMIGFLD